jgi:3-hydroxybutyrate dehydrogenase
MLKGKSAIVTGSTSGIGLGIAEALAAAGCNVMLNGFGDAQEIEKTRSDLETKNGVAVVYSGADMSKAESVTGMVREAEEKFGAVDILVNNAGIQHVSPIEDFPEAKYNAIIAINMSSNWHAIKAVMPGMKARKWGRILNLSSAHGLVASPYKTAYVMAKHGVVGLTKTIALETAQIGITCNAICPGYVRTPLVEKQIPDTAKTRGITEEEVVRDVMLSAQPTKQFVTVEQIGALAVFLASDSAAQITGASISVDGGWTAQ